jgi:hypothetical protein
MNQQSAPENSYQGFSALKAFLKELRNTYHAIPKLILRNKPSSGSAKVLTGVSFIYDDNPYPEWKRELILRLSGKSRGRTDIHYHHDHRKFRGKTELQCYLDAIRNPQQWEIERFDFKPVFCVCQKCEDPFRNFMECSYGKCGCNAWIHPECVGFGSRNEHELKGLPRLVCPFCSVYLKGIGRADMFSRDHM